MKKGGVIILFLSISMFSMSQQLDSVIRDIIKYKSATSFFEIEDTGMVSDSLAKNHLRLIKSLTNQRDLELILDTTHSSDLTYYCTQALVFFPSEKISDCFQRIMMDSNSYVYMNIENSCLSYSSNLTGTPYSMARYILEGTDSSHRLKEKLEQELIEMDSIWIFYKHLAPFPYNNEDGEFADFHIKRNLKNKNFKITKWILEDYFMYNIENYQFKVYGHQCGYGGFPPELRYKLELNIRIYDSTDLDYQIKEKLYSFNLWLNSEHKEVQVYGAEALIRLQNNGAVLTDKQIKNIKKLKRSFKRIKTCSGCSNGTDSIRNVLSPFELN